MKGYIIGELEITDPAGFQEYRDRLAPMLEKWGAHFIIRGGQLDVLEGEWRPRRLIVIEFPDFPTIRRWYQSVEYAPLIELRQACSEGSFVAIEGV